MKKVLVLAVALIILSCSSNNEDCTAETMEITNKYEKLVAEVRGHDYWDEEVVVRLYKDMNIQLDKLKCN